MNLGVHDESQHSTFEAEEHDPQTGNPCQGANCHLVGVRSLGKFVVPIKIGTLQKL